MITSDNNEIASHINEVLARVYTDDNSGILPKYDNIGGGISLSHIIFTDAKVRAALSKIKQSTSAGPDDIKGRVVFETKEVFIPHLSKIPNNPSTPVRFQAYGN